MTSKPELALGKRLGVAVHALDAVEACLFAHQGLVDRQHHLAADFQRACNDEIERARDRTLGGIFHRHHGKIGTAGFHRMEAGVDIRLGERLDVVAEMLRHGLLGEGARRAKVGDAGGFLERAAGRHDFADQPLDGVARQRAGVVFAQAPHDLRLTLGSIDLFALLGTPHFLGDAGALRYQLEDGVVDAVNACTQRAKLNLRAQRTLCVIRHAGRYLTASTPAMVESCCITAAGTALSTSASVYAMSPLDLFTMLWILSPAAASTAEICPTMLGTLALAIATRKADSRAMLTLGKLTELRMLPFSR